ncbi:MAG: threonylcarbamoyl-AMP synthase [Gammaproteobacteria bacterium]|nr:threonylcarbamoyl-AMP synthase [Gammaproteobacteria bacterium]
MGEFLQMHATNPESRFIQRVARCLLQGGVVVYPTDSTYALGCHIGNKSALDRIRHIRRLDNRHHFTLVCRDLSSLAIYSQVNNSAYRILKAHTPGPYTFVLKASAEVPRRLKQTKRNTIGLRIPENAIAQAILEQTGEPIMTTSLILPDESDALADPFEMRLKLGKTVDMIIDGGACSLQPTTLIDLVNGVPEVLRLGKGDPKPFQ